MAPNNIVIVGGGFAGTTLARELERRLPASHRVVLVSEESTTTFNPMLAEVVEPEIDIGPDLFMEAGANALASALDRRQRALLVAADQAAVADHIRGQDGGKTARDALRGH